MNSSKVIITDNGLIGTMRPKLIVTDEEYYKVLDLIREGKCILIDPMSCLDNIYTQDNMVEKFKELTSSIETMDIFSVEAIKKSLALAKEDLKKAKYPNEIRKLNHEISELSKDLVRAKQREKNAE